MTIYTYLSQCMIMIMIVALCSCSSQGVNNNSQFPNCYYQNNNSKYIESMYLDSDTTMCYNKEYYNDGSIMWTRTLKKSDSGEWVAYGECRSYYKDGFLKESYICDSTGLQLTPIQTGIVSGYKVVVDIDSTVFHQDSITFHPLRIYVENIPLIHYWVGIKERGTDSYWELMEIEKTIEEYTYYIPRSTKTDTFTTEIDESLYQYAIDEFFEEKCAIDSMGTRGYVFGIYFADTTCCVGTEPKLTIFVPFDFYKYK